MKRFLLFVVAFVMTFSLAACFDNPAVQEFTREFCETNPNDEICQLDITGDLTDAQVKRICNRRFGIGADGLMLLNSKFVLAIA